MATHLSARWRIAENSFECRGSLDPSRLKELSETLSRLLDRRSHELRILATALTIQFAFDV